MFAGGGNDTTITEALARSHIFPLQWYILILTPKWNIQKL